MIKMFTFKSTSSNNNLTKHYIIIDTEKQTIKRHLLILSKEPPKEKDHVIKTFKDKYLYYRFDHMKISSFIAILKCLEQTYEKLITE